ncbi:MAG: DUF1566 domain-containing protein [Prevotellaceae bacterium]|nr:DUF1566 domain-containing protein [Prevotellaceae bacterium]
MKKIIYLMIAAALLCGCTKKENERSSVTQIHGTVVTSGEPVNAAAILLTPGGGVKITGSDGMYKFADLQPGKYELKVFKEGFQSFNTSIDVAHGKDEEVTVILTRGAGNLSINKAYVDMGSNEGNNVAGFSILNAGNAELTWSVSNAARWITNVDPPEGAVAANSSAAVVFTIDRSKLSSNTVDNYAILVVRSTTAGDGSTAELLVTVFNVGDGANVTAVITLLYDGIMVQSYDISSGADWNAANNLCKSSRVAGYSDWRLPTRGELNAMYDGKTAIGGFSNALYWSSDRDSNYSSSYYYAKKFEDGSMRSYFDSNSFRARAVRTLP